jgi:hypothetical protein
MFHLLSIHETFDADVINHKIDKLRCGIFEFYEQFPPHGLVNFTMTNIVYCMGGDTFTRRFSLKPLLKHLSVSSSQVFGSCLSYPFSFGFCIVVFSWSYMTLDWHLSHTLLPFTITSFSVFLPQSWQRGKCLHPRRLNIYSPPHKA